MKDGSGTADPGPQSDAVVDEAEAWPATSLAAALEVYGNVLRQLRRLRDLREGRESLTS